jgi:hypothetical protein
MTLSVKPFGCMPSSGVSDGVQSLISERYPGTIFCAVETSGDGAVNFYSRVQMYLFKARIAAQAELDKALADNGLTLERVRAFLAAHPRYASALHRAPHSAASTTADLIYELAELINTTPWQRASTAGRKLVQATRAALSSGMKNAPENARSALQFSRELSRELSEIARDKAPELASSAGSALRERASKIVSLALPKTRNLAAAAG